MTQYISLKNLEIVKNYVFSINNEICGNLYETQTGSMASVVDRKGIIENDRVKVIPSMYTKYMWHTHPHTSKSYPSSEDIVRILGIHKDNVCEIIFTSWGIWKLFCNYKKELSERKKNFLLHEIQKILDVIYYSTEKGKILTEYGKIVIQACNASLIFLINLFPQFKGSFSIDFIEWPNYDYYLIESKFNINTCIQVGKNLAFFPSSKKFFLKIIDQNWLVKYMKENNIDIQVLIDRFFQNEKFYIDIYNLSMSEIINRWSYDECLNFFPLLLEERLKFRRKTFSYPLEKYSQLLALCLGIVEDTERNSIPKYEAKKQAKILRDSVTKNINYFLSDCEVFFEMSENKAMDALGELSNLAAIYADDPYNIIYTQIVLAIQKIQASYPNNVEWIRTKTFAEENPDENPDENPNVFESE